MCGNHASILNLAECSPKILEHWKKSGIKNHLTSATSINARQTPSFGTMHYALSTLPYLKTNQTRFWTNKSQNISALALCHSYYHFPYLTFLNMITTFGLALCSQRVWRYFWENILLVDSWNSSKIAFLPKKGKFWIFLPNVGRNDYIRLSCWKIWNEQCFINLWPLPFHSCLGLL